MNMLVRTRSLAFTGYLPVPPITGSVRYGTYFRLCSAVQSVYKDKNKRSSNMSTKTSTGGSSSSEAAPIIREFVRVDGGASGSGSARGHPDVIKFRVVSYNILAQVYVKSSLFPHSPSPCLRWKARSQAILTLLKNLQADFFCLQEVDEYDSFYKRNMKDHGYSSIYVQRSGQKRDGCGIFYKNNCAELLAKETIEYNDLVDLLQDEAYLSADKQNKTLTNMNNGAGPKNDSSVKCHPEHHGDPNDPCVRLKRDCVGIMAAYKLKDPFHHVIILANTHLYWDPEWADVKLAQAKYLLSRLDQFKTLVTDKFDCTPSLILSGDFNSTPGDKVYQYLISGNPSSASSIRCLEELPLPLCSVHAFTRGEPSFTNCTPDFTNTLDYIFFSPSDCLKPISVLELPVLDSPDVTGGLPNYSHPSDHLPIGAEFEVTKE